MDQGDKTIAQVGSLMDQSKCLFLLDCMIYVRIMI